MLVLPHAVHANRSSHCFCGGRAQALRSAKGHPPGHHWPKTLVLSRTPGLGGQEQVGTWGPPPPFWVLVWTSQMVPLFLHHLPRPGEEVLHLWHPVWGCPWKISSISTVWGWGTGLIFWMTPLACFHLETLFWQLPAWDLGQWLQLHECQWPWLSKLLNLSALSSSSPMATSACQWASLTTAKVSSQEPCIVSFCWS